MRKINRAVLKQSIHISGSGSFKTSSTKSTFCVSDEFFQQQGQKSVVETLKKYVVFKDHNCHYWIDRYWYFDVEQYQKDLEAFGIPMAMPVMEPIKNE